MWEGPARWSTQLRRGCWVATGLSRWKGCSDPQESGRGRESINQAKMKLCPGCHNPFASSKLYKLFAVFFAFGWWLIWYSWDPICRDVAFEFRCSPELICGNTGKDVLFMQNKRRNLQLQTFGLIYKFHEEMNGNLKCWQRLEGLRILHSKNVGEPIEFSRCLPLPCFNNLSWLGKILIILFATKQ